MKVSKRPPHSQDVRPATATLHRTSAHAGQPWAPSQGSGSQRVLPDAEVAQRLDFSEVYDRWFGDVVRWVRACGGPDAEIEDLAQEVFMVVRRKLHSFDGRNLAGWLYKITRLTVHDHSRRAWFRHMFLGRRDIELDELPENRISPAIALEQKEEQLLLQQMLSRMSDKRREAFVLFEIEGYSGEDIARMQDIPVNTVWTRLHHARKEFVAMVAELRASRGLSPEGKA